MGSGAPCMASSLPNSSSALLSRPLFGCDCSPIEGMLSKSEERGHGSLMVRVVWWRECHWDTVISGMLLCLGASFPGLRCVGVATQLSPALLRGLRYPFEVSGSEHREAD